MDWSSVNTFPKLLKKLRKATGVSQKDVADDTDLASGTLSMYENAKRFPPLNTLVRLLEFFGVEIHLKTDFGTWKLRESPKTDETFRIKKIDGSESSLFKGLPEDEIEDIYSFIQRRRKRHSDSQDNA